MIVPVGYLIVHEPANTQRLLVVNDFEDAACTMKFYDSSRLQFSIAKGGRYERTFRGPKAGFVEVERTQLRAVRDKSPEGAPEGTDLAALDLEREDYLTRARDRLDELVRLNPTREAWAHFQMAAALTALKDPRARPHAQRALQVHQEAESPVYQLPPAQLEQVRRWSGP